MQKPECVQEYVERKLVLSDEKCGDCPFRYECVFMAAEMEEVAFGGW